MRVSPASATGYCAATCSCGRAETSSKDVAAQDRGFANRMANVARLRSSLSIVSGLPCEKARSAPAIVVSRPAAFTRVTTCTLTESPSDPLHRRLRQLRCLCCRFDCYQVQRTSSRAGVSPAEVQHLFTAHFFTNYDQAPSLCDLLCLAGHGPACWFSALGMKHARVL
jgi:AraC-like DNA-binding protein